MATPSLGVDHAGWCCSSSQLPSWRWRLSSCCAVGTLLPYSFCHCGFYVSRSARRSWVWASCMFTELISAAPLRLFIILSTLFYFFEGNACLNTKFAHLSLSALHTEGRIFPPEMSSNTSFALIQTAALLHTAAFTPGSTSRVTMAIVVITSPDPIRYQP